MHVISCSPQGYVVIADKQTLRMQTRLQEEREKKAAQDKKESEVLLLRKLMASRVQNRKSRP